MADNLLDKASILLTPTAYNDGSMLSVKPENGDGDFTFSRSSAATRVNAQGLVENVQIISSELVSNGNFSQIGTEEVSNGNFSQEGSELVTNGNFATDSDWTKGNDANINDSKAIISSTVGDSWVLQSNKLTVGKSYKITLKVDSVTLEGGVAKFALGTGADGNTYNITENGVFNFYFSNISFSLNWIQIFTNGDASVTIDNVSVKEVGQDWTLGSGWSIGEDKASRTAQSGSTSMYQSVSFTANKSYKITYDLDISAGSFLLRIGGGALIDTTPRTTSGTYTEYIVANSGNNVLNLRAVDGNFNGSITNISVKEVGQDWTFGTGWSVGDDKASCDGSQSSQSNLYQAGIVPINNTYKVTFDIVVTSGSIYLSIGGSNAQPTVSSSGTYTFTSKATTGDSNLYFSTNSTFIGSITNISVKEITDDTDLPRINYEGFSYQDVLGSEEVVNGGFDTDSNWTKGTGWTIANGKATQLGGTGQLSQVISTTVSTLCKITFTANVTSGAIRIAAGPSAAIADFTSGTHTLIVPFLGSTTLYILGSSASFAGSIDNVSVKEVLGQEVVPDSGCGSWLLEGQSTNLITYSSDFSNAAWSKSNITLASGFTSPDGTNNAYKMTDDATDSLHRIIDGITTSSSGSFTYSIFLKKGTLTTAQFQVFNSGTASSADVDLVSGTITSGGQGINHTIQDYGNDWFRCSISGTLTSTSTTVYLYLKQKASYIGNGDYLYAWGAQLEQNSFSTSYIPTSGATSTRLQDIATNSGNSTLINSTEGVLYAEIAGLSSPVDSPKNITISDGTASNYVRIEFYQDGKVYGNVYDGTSVSASFVINQDEYNKIAIQYSSSGSKLYVNGTGVNFASKIFTSNTLNTIQFSNAQDSASYFHGKAKALAVYKEALTDANLRSLTYPNPVATTFDLDFDTIAEQFTFTRGSEATFVNAQGLIESTASNDAPRIDYSTGEKAFLLEPQSTNLVTYSEDFENYFNVTEITLNSNYAISPDGTLNANKLTFPSTSNSMYKSGLSLSGMHTISFYVKGEGANIGKTFDVNINGTSVDQNIDVTLTNEWVRFEAQTDGLTLLQITNRSSTTIGTGSLILFGFQVEASSYATSYIPTSGASATRNQELCNNATPVINSEEGTLYAEISALANDGTIRYLSLSDGTSNNRVTILYYSSSNNIRMIVSSNGTNYADKNYGVSSVLDFHKIAIKYKENDFALWVDGIEVKTDNSGNAPIGLDNLSFSIGGGDNFHGNTKGLKYYPKALADVQLEDLTTI